MSTKRKKTLKPRKKKEKPNIIALITDFGLRDQYVSAMKGVIYSINPNVQIIDITHEIGPQKIKQAGYLLWSTYKFFPKGTIFISVVDPGVGSKRRMIIVRTKEYIFLSPDNGLLNFVRSTDDIVEEIELEEKNLKQYLINPVSSTFHGRDIFAPVAAYLSKNVSPIKFGTVVPPKEFTKVFVDSKITAVQPCVLHIDHFGNIITNVAPINPEKVAQEIQAILLDKTFISKWIRFYEEAPSRTPSLIIGSNGLVEIVVNKGNAAQMLNANLNTSVKVYWR